MKAFWEQRSKFSAVRCNFDSKRFCLFRSHCSMEQLLPFINIADCILHCTQIDLSEWGTVLEHPLEIIFCFRDDRARSTWSETEKRSIMFFAPKIYALIHLPASLKRRPLATYVARARDFALATSSLEINSVPFSFINYAAHCLGWLSYVKRLWMRKHWLCITTPKGRGVGGIYFQTYRLAPNLRRRIFK